MNPPTLFQKMRVNRHAAWLRMERQRQIAEYDKYLERTSERDEASKLENEEALRSVFAAVAGHLVPVQRKSLFSRFVEWVKA
jgi:hypothetical protein